MRNSRWPEATFLGGLADVSVTKLMALGWVKEYPAGSTLLRQGDKSLQILLITHGVVKVVTRSVDGDEMLTAIRIAGDTVGEMGVFESRPRSASVIASSKVSVRALRKSEFDSFLREEPGAMDSFICMNTKRVRGANRRRLDFVAYAAPTRLARVLVELAEIYGSATPHRPATRCVEMAVTQRELASLAGIRLNTAVKALAELEEGCVIQRGYGKVTVNNMTGLLHAAKLRR